ncbi:metal-dependent hydrolase family protein [Steroidobacter sp.]|uniref:metal-dependent hydrolase family protein n=1 Tax=Steroidobacter sp. TaxID=1978227 RepID=UPI001A414927|nr:amidohydrolase family protein [Steroidobacter sp.]MBL8265736.1 amidohydrolase family protein [Steroidobacter sp.]
MRLAVQLALAMIAAAGSVHAAETSQPVVLKAAYLFDSKSGTLSNGGTVVVEGNKIKAIGAGSVPANAKVIDLGDATLLPGFIDAHTHITSEIQADYYKGFHTDMYRFAPEQSHYAAVYAKRTLEAGFTTIRNLGAGEFVDVGLRNAVNVDVTPGPTILTAVHAIGSTGGHCDQGPFPPDRVAPLGVMDGVCNGADECRTAVRYQLKWGADVIKICSSGGVLSEADPVDVPQLTPAELTAIVSETHAWKRKVAAHSHGDLAARQAVEAGVDSIEHGSFLTDETLKLMKAKGTYLVPTRLAVYWVNQMADKYPPAIAAKARATLTEHEKVFRKALQLGVPIALGTDSGVSPHGMNAKEFALLVDIGMQPAAALISGTRESAKLLGIGNEVGTLEAGKLADIVAVKGNVLANIASTEKPVFVMKHGHVVVQP